MFTLLSIQQTADATPQNAGGRAIRCLILADNTTDTLPTTGQNVEHMGDDQTFMPGSIAITPAFDVAMFGNDGKWGAWA